MSSVDFSDAKAFLMKAEDGTSAYEHLQNLVLKLVTERPSQCVGLFEHLSRTTKQTSFKPAAGYDGAKYGAAAASKSADATELKYNTSCADLFKVDEEKVAEVPPVQDLMFDLGSLEYCGVSFGPTEGYRIYMAMKNLAAKMSMLGELQSLRFWGKILGTSKDYFVCQGQYKSEDDPEPEDSKDLEINMNSPNKFTYWVCNSLADEWQQLPLVKASQIVAARKIKRFFTGDLTAPVKGHPPFPGSELEYLRAQIAQITAACSLSPSGFFKQSEDEFLMVPNEEMEPIESVDELKDIGSWRSHHLEINAEGRCVAFPVTDEEGTVQEVEPPEMLKTPEENHWTLSAPMTNKVCVRSRVWPGGNAVGFGRHFAWIYVGYGQRSEEQNGDLKMMYTPAPPAPPQPEFNDMDIKEQEDVLKDPTPPEDDEDGADE